MRACNCARASPFQSRTREGCDHSWYVPYRLLWVSIHAPAWGATSYQYVAGYVTKFQSTHPRGVRQARAQAAAQQQAVSIHAPAWGATTRGMFPIVSFGFQSTHPRGVRRVRPFSSLQYFRVSIHAPAWGATASSEGIQTLLAGFNPRTRVGCDVEDLRRIPHEHVSIHAPAWGATCTVVAWAAWRVMFQSTHPRGVRPARSFHLPTKAIRFNPRTRVGCDVFKTVHLTREVRFNPRTRVGCDTSGVSGPIG